MQRRVYRTSVRPEFRQQYVDAHKEFPGELLRRYRKAGMHSCAVYLLDCELVMVIESENPERLAKELGNDAIDRAWQNYVGPMKADGDWQLMEEIFHTDAIPSSTN